MNDVIAFARTWAAKIGQADNERLIEAIADRAAEALRCCRSQKSDREEARAAQSPAHLFRALKSKPFQWKLACVREHGSVPIRPSSGFSGAIWQQLQDDVAAAENGDTVANSRLMDDAIALIDAPRYRLAYARRDAANARALIAYAVAIWAGILERPYWVDFKPVQTAEFKEFYADFRKLAGIKARKVWIGVSK